MHFSWNKIRNNRITASAKKKFFKAFDNDNRNEQNLVILCVQNEKVKLYFKFAMRIASYPIIKRKENQKKV